MATEKILNTRVQLKYDSYENWIATANQFKLRPGEVAVVNINGANGANLNNGTENTVVQPTILFKVGIGDPANDTTWKTFNQLPWASALAADVHTWAKKSLEEFTAWVAKTPKTVTLSVNGENTDYTIEEAIKLVRNEITAGGEAAAITIDDESTDGKIKYTAKQGGTAIVESIEVNEGTGIKISVEDNVPKISHQAKPTDGMVIPPNPGTGRTYITQIYIDDMGHITNVEAATETNQDLSNYKTKQTVVNDPTANGNATAFIDSISQNANGEITVSKKSIDFATLVPANETELTITDKPTAVLEDGLVYAVTNLEEGGTNGHEVTATYEAVATKTYVDKRASGAVDYLGTVSDSESVNAKFTTNTQIGDFARASNTFTYVYGGDVSIEIHAGDLLIRDSGNEPFLFTVIHGEEGDITEIVAGDGLTGGGSVGSITIGLDEATQQEIANKKDKQTAVTNKITDNAHVLSSLTQNENGDISYEVKELTPEDIGAVKTIAFDAGQVITVDGQDVPTIPGFKLVVDDVEQLVEVREGNGVIISADTANTANNDASSWLEIGIQDKGVTTVKIADKAVATAQIADHAVGAHQTKACTDYTGDDAEVWVFNCGSATVNV